MCSLGITPDIGPTHAGCWGFSSVGYPGSMTTQNPNAIGISDDRPESAPARFYPFTLPMGRDRFRDTAPRFEAVTTLLDANAEPFA